MQIRQAAELFQSGMITAFTAARDIRGTQWLLMVNMGDKTANIETVREEFKQYRTFEALERDIFRITGRMPKSLRIQP